MYLPSLSTQWLHMYPTKTPGRRADRVTHPPLPVRTPASRRPSFLRNGKTRLNQRSDLSRYDPPPPRLTRPPHHTHTHLITLSHPALVPARPQPPRLKRLPEGMRSRGRPSYSNCYSTVLTATTRSHHLKLPPSLPSPPTHFHQAYGLAQQCARSSKWRGRVIRRCKLRSANRRRLLVRAGGGLIACRAGKELAAEGPGPAL